MKKKIKTVLSWIGGIFIGLVLLTMCGVIEEEETEKKAEPKTEQTEVKPNGKALDEKPKEAEKPKELTEAEKKAIEETLRLEENKIYAKAMLEPFSVFVEGTSALSAQTISLSENFSVRFNKEWLTTTANALVDIEQAANEIKTIQPTNEQTKVIQNLMNEIADHYLYIVANYPPAIDNMDIDLINSITDETAKANEKLKEVNLLTENLNNPME